MQEAARPGPAQQGDAHNARGSEGLPAAVSAGRAAGTPDVGCVSRAGLQFLYGLLCTSPKCYLQRSHVLRDKGFFCKKTVPH